LKFLPLQLKFILHRRRLTVAMASPPPPATNPVINLDPDDDDDDAQSKLTSLYSGETPTLPGDFRCVHKPEVHS
jgi:hypothetical protein